MWRFALILSLIILPMIPAAPARAVGCGQPPKPDYPNQYYFPLILKGAIAAMPKNALENIEKLVRKPADFPFDGWVTDIYPGTVNVKLVGSNRIKRNVTIPDHIPPENIFPGVPAKLNTSLGRPSLLAVYPNLVNELAAYSGKGSVIPSPPAISVEAKKNGWLVTWNAVSGADRYRVYRNDDPDETSPDDLGYTTQTQMLVPYESPYIYFAVRAVSGLNESELSGWLTDNTPPPVPDTFAAEDDFKAHRLTISVNDNSLTDNGFKCWEVEQADDDSGTNSVSLGFFGPTDFPNFVSASAGVTKYYRIRSWDYGIAASNWTAWDSATALELSGNGTFQDGFDDYGGDEESQQPELFWLKLSDADSDEPYTGELALGEWSNFYNAFSGFGQGSKDTSYLREGDEAVKCTAISGGSTIASASLTYLFEQEIDLANDSRFGNDDYLYFALYVIDPNSAITDADIEVYVHTDDSYFGSPGAGFKAYVATESEVAALGAITEGLQFIKIKKSDFVVDGTPDWSKASGFMFLFTATSSVVQNWSFVIDDIRIRKASPSDSTVGNDTGDKWLPSTTGAEFPEWRVLAGNRAGEPEVPFTYGQIYTKADNGADWAASFPVTTTENNIDIGLIQSGVYLKEISGESSYNNNQAGLAFFVKEMPAGSAVTTWEFYALEIDADNDELRFVKWISGNRTVISTVSYTVNLNEELWVGINMNEFSSNGGLLKFYASRSPGGIIRASNLVMVANDTSLSAGGNIALLSKWNSVRFFNLVAGSPAHAVIADVAYALDGPIIAGDKKRVRFNPDTNWFEWSTDGVTWTDLVAPS